MEHEDIEPAKNSKGLYPCFERLENPRCTRVPRAGLRLGACRAWGVEAFTECGGAKIGPSEDSFCRIRRLIAIAMGREADEKWTAAVN